MLAPDYFNLRHSSFVTHHSSLRVTRHSHQQLSLAQQARYDAYLSLPIFRGPKAFVEHGSSSSPLEFEGVKSAVAHSAFRKLEIGCGLMERQIGLDFRATCCNVRLFKGFGGSVQRPNRSQMGESEIPECNDKSRHVHARVCHAISVPIHSDRPAAGQNDM